MDLRIHYPHHIFWFRPFEVIDRPKVPFAARQVVVPIVCLHSWHVVSRL